MEENFGDLGVKGRLLLTVIRNI